MRRLLVLLTVLAACSRPSDEDLGLRAHTRDAVRLSRLDHPDELLMALDLPGALRDRVLGAHHVDVTSTVELEGSGAKETLEESYRLDSDGRGALHLVHENNKGGGIEAVVTGGLLYVRPRFGKFVQRRPEPGELERLRATAHGLAAAYLRAVAGSLVVREGAGSETVGRRAVRLKLTASGSSARAGAGWRSTLKVRSTDGEVVLDQASGVPLEVRLATSYSFVREGADKPLVATLKLTQSTRAGADPITTPTDFATPSRTRPMLDQKWLLDGLTGKERP
jgi:hypothetical protein